MFGSYRCMQRISFCSKTLANSQHLFVNFSSTKPLVISNKSTPHRSSCRSFHTAENRHGKVVPFLLADIGEGIREVVIKEWFVVEGTHVEQFDRICEVQSDKASVTITSRYDGRITKRHYNIDDTALVGDPLLEIELSKGEVDQVDDVNGSKVTEQLQSELPSNPISEKVLPRENNLGKVLATPAVRRIASEYKIQLGDVVGTGKDGRVMKEDVLNYVNKAIPGRSPPAAPAPSQPQVSTMSKPVNQQQFDTAVGEDTVIILQGIKKAMVKSMTEALSIPHFGYYDEVNMTELVKLRKELKKSPMLGEVQFTYMPVMIKATSLALKDYPVLNSSLIGEDKVLQKAAHNIGFAMDSPDGLIVPNIKDVQNLSILEIAIELDRIVKLGQQRKLGQDDITGGTFSLSNIGSIGGTYAKPVILPPQAAIGALGKIQALPRYDEDDNLVKQYIMKVSWSADHRIVEGALMARFSNLWRSYLENPSTLILHMK
ncbi:hypothetical protein EB796_019492 [Bugula neritina]|uniref:Dihydrolipoamide acetyltransferase component of pyruvate dehydrogenase complex n=1 Tax=Bugula neritina TaxID=10212 RepID=A0A7J7J7Q3_BUGNE|nr:hypothetical protein EB796_019492 [Bugula neritina]